ncbi:hypothetical protein OG871_01850 [Kitasatospora sp. NBC_00374]|uniref:hypothetical protein n=1 Tax=Kitasatospora sp. NBC_00374 TaxID=2975964 RepID=UPI0030E091F8
MAEEKPTPKSHPWEDMLRAFAGQNQSTITTREDVTAEKWIGYVTVTTANSWSQNDRKKKSDYYHYSGYDMWAEWVYPDLTPNGLQHYTTLVGATFNWPTWDDPPAGSSNTTLGNFEWAAENILSPLIWGSGDNGRTSAASFDNAATAIAGLDTWCGLQQKKVQGWADSVDGAGSDFQGSAAGRFKEVLIGLRSEFDQVHQRLGGDSGRIAAGLQHAGEALRTAHRTMYNDGYNKWRSDEHIPDFAGGWTYKEDKGSLSWPHACLRLAFMMETGNLTPTYDKDSDKVTWVNREGGITPTDGGDSPFALALEATAKRWWTFWAAWTLDSAARAADIQLTRDFGTAAGMLGSFKPPAMIFPTDKPPATEDSKTDGGPGGKDGPKDDKGPDLGSMGAGPPPPKTKTGPPPPVTGNLGGVGGGGGQSALLDKNGKPLLGKDGKPLTVPPGTKVNEKGELIGPDGKPLLGADGKPRMVPPGTTIGLPPPIGSVFKLPAGSKVNEDGTVTGPDGAKIRDANGNPVVLDKGSTIDKGGVVRDADGRTVSPFEQLLADQQRVIANRTAGVLTGGTGGSGASGVGLPVSWGGLGDSIGTSRVGESFGNGGGTGASGVRTGGITAGPPTVGVGGRLSSLGVAKGAAAMAEEAVAARGVAAQRAAAATAAEEAELMGRRVSTTGGAGAPMVPPMGGAGAAGGQGEKERQRTTWLAEDEEVWGTDAGGVTGVIGR